MAGLRYCYRDHSDGQGMYVKVRQGWVAFLGLVLLTACSSTVGRSSTPSSSTPAAASSPSGGVELGTDPGDQAYRRLDLCALVDLDKAQAAGGDTAWATATREPNGPSTCLLSNEQTAIRWRVPEPHDQLPTSVTAPTDVSEDLDTTPAGSVVLDKACTLGHVVSNGYVIAVELADPSATGACTILKNVADQVRNSLAAGPPELTVPQNGATAADLCQRLEATGLAAKLGLGDVRPATADHRVCLAGPDGGTQLVLRTGNGDRSLQKTAARLKPPHGLVIVDGECTVHARVDEGDGPSQYWLTLVLEQPGPSATCPGGATLLGEPARDIATAAVAPS